MIRWTSTQLLAAWAALASFVGLAVFVTATGNSLLGDVAVHTFIWAGIAMAWNLTAGFAGRLSLGHAAYFGLGAYATAILYEGQGIVPWIGLLVGMAVAGAMAAVVEVATVRLAGVYYSLATFAMAELLGILARGWRELTQGTAGITIPFRPGFLNMTFVGKSGYVWLSIGYVAFVFVLIFALYHTRFGVFLRAQRDEPDAARSIGVNAERVRLIAGTVSASLAAAGGTLYTQYLLFTDPEVAFNWYISVHAALIGIIGGLGTLGGPLWGALLLVPAERWLIAALGGSYGGLAPMVYGLVLIAAVLLAPRGLVSLLERARGSHRRSVRAETPAAQGPAGRAER